MHCFHSGKPLVMPRGEVRFYMFTFVQRAKPVFVFFLRVQYRRIYQRFREL